MRVARKNSPCSRTRWSSWFVAIGVIALTAVPRAQLGRDPRLLDKLYNADFGSISDSNASRLDVAAVIMSFTKAECLVPLDSRSGSDATLTILAYARYLSSDSETGAFPSQESLALSASGLLVQDPTALLALNGNFVALAAEIARSGCRSQRVQTIGRNIARLLDERMAWHRENRGQFASLQRQMRTPVTRRAYQEAVDRDVMLRARDQVIAQLDAFEARGVQLRECVYGPTKPDGTGSESVVFWDNAVPATTVELAVLASRHPLRGYGDQAVTQCPARLPEAVSARRVAQDLGESRVTRTTVPDDVLLEQVLGQLYPRYQAAKVSWLTFKAGGEERYLRQAIVGKSDLVPAYRRSCDFPPPASVDPEGRFCRVAKILAAEFADIPDSLQAARANGLAAGASPNRTANPPPIRTEYGPLPAVAFMVQTLEPINLAERDDNRRYKARLTAPIGSQGRLIAPVGVEVLLKVEYRESTDPTRPQDYAAITAVSIALDGQPTAISTREMRRPVPGAGGRSTGSPILRAGTPLQFAIGPPR